MESPALDDTIKFNLKVKMQEIGIFTEKENPNKVRSGKSKARIQTPPVKDTGRALRGRGRVTQFIIGEVVECQWSAGGTQLDTDSNKSVLIMLLLCRSTHFRRCPILQSDREIYQQQRCLQHPVRAHFAPRGRCVGTARFAADARAKRAG